MNLARPFKAGLALRNKGTSRSDGMKLLTIVFIASLTRRMDYRFDLIPALKGWAKFMLTLRVARTAYHF